MAEFEFVLIGALLIALLACSIVLAVAATIHIIAIEVRRVLRIRRIKKARREMLAREEQINRMEFASDAVAARKRLQDEKNEKFFSDIRKAINEL